MGNTKKNAIVEDENIEETVKPAAKKVNKPKHDPNELVMCRSVRFGELRLIGPKTRMPYSWANEGDFREVEYQDLVSWPLQLFDFVYLHLYSLLNKPTRNIHPLSYDRLLLLYNQ